MHDFLKEMSKNKSDNNFITGTVSSLSPLQVKIIPTDDAINVVPTTGLNGVNVGSRLLLMRFQDQFIALCVIGSNMLSAFKTSDESINSDDSLNSDSELYLDIPPGRWEIYFTGYASCTDVDVDIYIDWSTTGDITLVSKRTCLGPTHSMTSAYNCSMRTAGYALGTNIAYGVEGTAEGGRTSCIHDKFVISSATGNGTLTMRWCQYTSSVDYLTLEEGSYIKAIRI